MKLKIRLASLVLLCFARQVYADCFDDLAYSAELHSIRDKVALAGVNHQTFSMMANEGRPTPDEKQALYKWGLYREQCFSSNPSALRDGFDTTQSLILELHNGVITYGQFAKLRRENASAVTAKSQQQILQMLMLQQQQSSPQQYQPPPVYQPPQQYRPPQPAPPLYQPPVTTKCRWDAYAKETVCETR